MSYRDELDWCDSDIFDNIPPCRYRVPISDYDALAVEWQHLGEQLDNLLSRDQRAEALALLMDSGCSLIDAACWLQSYIILRREK